MESLTKQFEERMAAFLRRTRLTPSEFGKRAIGDRKTGLPADRCRDWLSRSSAVALVLWMCVKRTARGPWQPPIRRPWSVGFCPKPNG